MHPARPHASRLVLAALASALTLPVGAQPHDHGAHAEPAAEAATQAHDAHAAPAHATAGLAALHRDAQGHRWATDAALRQNMARLRTAVEQAPAGMDAAAAARLADAVDRAIADLVAQCRLAPEADAVLHVLLGEFAAAAQALRADAQAAAGRPRLLAALNAYPQYFDDPGFAPLPH